MLVCNGTVALLPPTRLEQLCERIGIMSDGYMQCLGTANELKFRFGEGYTLQASINRKAGGKLDAVHKFIDELFPEPEELKGQEFTVKKRFADTFGTQVKYVIKRDHVILWKVFEAFEKNKERLSLSDWAITETTLEEVFLKLSDAYVAGGFEDFKKKLKEQGRSLSFREWEILLFARTSSAGAVRLS